MFLNRYPCRRIESKHCRIFEQALDPESDPKKGTTLSTSTITTRRALRAGAAVALAAALGFAGAVAPANAAETPEIVSEERLLVLPQVAEVSPGETVTYDVIVVDEYGDALEPQPEFDIYIGSDDGSDTWDGATLTAGKPGPRTIFARGMFDETTEYYGFADVWVIGDPVELTITAEKLSVEKGGSVSFTVEGIDEWDTPIDGSKAVLTSSVGTDVVDGNTVTFPTASTHVITASLGGATASVSIEVSDAASVIVPSGSGVSSGPVLAETGVETDVIVLVAGFVLAAGAVLAFSRRRFARPER